MKELTFRQWLRENGYKQPEVVRERYLSIGATDEDIEKIDAEYDRLADQYMEECEEQGYFSYFD